MTPREKAAQLVVDNQLKIKSLGYKEAVECAKVIVDEILNIGCIEVPYWYEVKQELEKL
jgi:hypothetical protein